jgi:hypothetical protein
MVTVEATSRALSTYKELLVSDWTKSLPNEVVSLLWNSLGGHESVGETSPLWQILDPNEASVFPLDFFQSIVVRITDGTSFVRLAGLPDLPVKYDPPKTPSIVARRANRLATYLTLPAHVAIAGETGFFMDVLALGFQAAIHFVLPELRRKHEAEHSILLHSAVLFCVGYSAYEPAHYAYMMSMIHGYLGDENHRLQSLFAAFRFTSPQDHSYLTKAQEFWTELLDQNRFDEAEQFLLSLHRWSSPAQQDEVREMVVDAFSFIEKAKKTKKERSQFLAGGAKSLTPFFL